MRLNIKTSVTLLIMAAVSAGLAAAQTPKQQPPSDGNHYRSGVALGYSYLRSNAPPGGCGCFSLNGGNATYAWLIKPEGNIALVDDITTAHANSISSSGYGLTLSTYTAGARYLPRLGHSPMDLFGQVLIGFAHSSGSRVQGQNAQAANAGAAFASNFGGGLDLRTSQHFSIRLVEIDYLLTTFDNGHNNHQNILRVGAGAVVRFGRR
jgi:outer membrane immunogenic protein